MRIARMKSVLLVATMMKRRCCCSGTRTHSSCTCRSDSFFALDRVTDRIIDSLQRGSTYPAPALLVLTTSSERALGVSEQLDHSKKKGPAERGVALLDL